MNQLTKADQRIEMLVREAKLLKLSFKECDRLTANHRKSAALIHQYSEKKLMGFYVHFSIIVTGQQDETELVREKILQLQSEFSDSDFDLVSKFMHSGWNGYSSLLK